MAVKFNGSRPQQPAQPTQDAGLGDLSFQGDRNLVNLELVNTKQALSEVVYRFVNTTLGTETPFQASQSLSQRLSPDGGAPGMQGDKVLAEDGMVRFSARGVVVRQTQPIDSEVATSRDESVSTVLVLGGLGGARIAA